jgi:hypothetical protein
MNNRGCPKCAGNIQLSNEEIDRRLEDRSIARVDDYPGRNTDKITWKCLIDGHIWKANVSEVLYKKTGCSVCSGNKPKTNENIDSILENYNIVRLSDYKNNSSKFQVKCLHCNNTFDIYLYQIHKNKDRSCPFCRSYEKKESQLSRIKDKLDKHGIVIMSNYSGVNEKHDFIDSFGNEWTDTIGNVITKYSLVEGQKYNKSYRFSQRENMIYSYLRDSGVSFERHYKLENEHRFFIVDFIVNDRIVVEYNGKQHYEPVDFFGGLEQYEKQIKRDNDLKTLCYNNSIEYIEIPYYLTDQEIFDTIDKLV